MSKKKRGEDVIWVTWERREAENDQNAAPQIQSGFFLTLDMPLK